MKVVYVIACRYGVEVVSDVESVSRKVEVFQCREPFESCFTKQVRADFPDRCSVAVHDVECATESERITVRISGLREWGMVLRWNVIQMPEVRSVEDDSFRKC